MDEIDALMEALRTVYRSLEKLKSIEGPELHVPGSIDQYQSLLEDAYAAYDRVETTVEELGQALEYEHARLEKAVKRDGQASE
jgi:prefoldin subunit 5